MSSRLTRTLLKLYPRRIRNRYGDELLDLQDELRAQDDVSRTHLIRDMLAGALLVWPARRAYLMIGAVLVIGGLGVGGAAVGGPGNRFPRAGTPSPGSAHSPSPGSAHSPQRCGRTAHMLCRRRLVLLVNALHRIRRSALGRRRCCLQQPAGHPKPATPHGNALHYVSACRASAPGLRRWIAKPTSHDAAPDFRSQRTSGRERLAGGGADEASPLGSRALEAAVALPCPERSGRPSASQRWAPLRTGQATFTASGSSLPFRSDHARPYDPLGVNGRVVRRSTRYDLWPRRLVCPLVLGSSSSSASGLT